MLKIYTAYFDYRDNIEIVEVTVEVKPKTYVVVESSSFPFYKGKRIRREDNVCFSPLQALQQLRDKTSRQAEHLGKELELANLHLGLVELKIKEVGP